MSMRAMYIGIAGMKSQQDAMSIIANNIANADTDGFKSQAAVFEDMFYQQLKSPSAPGTLYAGEDPIDIGNGATIAGITTDESQGNIVYTGSKTDMAIQGDGYFVVGDVNGQNEMYTRAGGFQTSPNNQLVTTDGQYVLGWNIGPDQTTANAGAALQPIKIPIGEVNSPVQTTNVSLKGNLNVNDAQGTVTGVQVPTHDLNGTEHDINVNFVKGTGNTFYYTAIPLGVAASSASIQNPVLDVNGDTAPLLVKGNYQIKTASGATPGTVDISVVDPSGTTLFTQNITDTNQPVTLMNGSQKWFTFDYQTGGVPSTATYPVGEVGTVTFNANGQISAMTGSGPNGTPLISFTPPDTNQPVAINGDFAQITGFPLTDSVAVDKVNGNSASTLTDYTITDGGIINGYYSDGTVKPIAQVALATFTNPSGLTPNGNGEYTPSTNSGLAQIGFAQTAFRGGIKSQAKESSNVDLAKQFVDMLTNQKNFTANTKIIRTTDSMMQDVLLLVQ